MPEANTENRLFTEQTAHAVDSVGQGGGVAGAVRKEDAVRVERERGLGRGVGGHDRDLEAAVDQAAQDVALGAVVEGDDVEVASARRAAAVAWIERGHAPLGA